MQRFAIANLYCHGAVSSNIVLALKYKETKVGDIKDYRDKELKLYALENIFVIVYIEKIITIDGILNQKDKFATLLVTIFNSALFCPFCIFLFCCQIVCSQKV